ncbi:MAG: hypothetical protein AAF364_20030 [Pseudomonadota bacterium]
MQVDPHLSQFRGSGKSGIYDPLSRPSAMANFSEITLKRNGKGYLLDDRFIYIKNREANNILYLKCHSWRTCSAKAKIQNGQAIITAAAHNHDLPDSVSLDFRSKVLSAAKNPTNARLSLGEIYHNTYLTEFRDQPAAAVANSVPSLSTLRSTMSAARSSYLPPAPTSLAEIDSAYLLQNCKTSNGYSFLLACSLPTEADRFFIFANTGYFERISECKELFLDGTFWTVPGIFAQLVTIHGEILGQVLPLVYILLPRMLQAGYEKMWESLKAVLQIHNLNLNGVETVICDFEPAALAAIRVCLPHVKIRGCFFHFAQAIYRNIDQTAYRNEPAYREKIRLIIALGHVPAVEKMLAIQDLRPILAQDPRVIYFFDDYFNRNWITGRPLDLWDWHNVEKRTNNHCEGYHSALKRFFKIPHLSMYKFAFVLLDSEKAVEKNFYNRLAGNPLPPVNADYARVAENISRLHAELSNRERTYVDFLRGISYNVPEMRN